jgi:hypothetical protein
MADTQACGQRLVNVLDLRTASALNAQQRRIQANWNKEVETLMRAVTLALAFVTDSATTRGVMTAVFRITPPAAHYNVCAEMNEALDWAFSTCENRGYRLPDSARRECRELFMSPIDSIAPETPDTGAASA